jgi:hypothetical protein
MVQQQSSYPHPDPPPDSDAHRLELHILLKTFTTNVYFQPPDKTKIEYPCIIYNRDSANTKFADDKPYSIKKRYLITIIDANPDSNIPSKVAAMPMSLFNRFFTVDNLNHDVYSVYF